MFKDRALQGRDASIVYQPWHPKDPYEQIYLHRGVRSLRMDFTLNGTEIAHLQTIAYYCLEGYDHNCTKSLAHIANECNVTANCSSYTLKVLEEAGWIKFRGLSEYGTKIYIINQDMSEYRPVTDELRNSLKSPSRAKAGKHLSSPSIENDLFLNPVPSNSVVTNILSSQNDRIGRFGQESYLELTKDSILEINRKNDAFEFANSCLSESKKNQENSESYKIDIEDTEKKKEEECLSIGATLTLRCLEIEGIEEEEIHALAVKDKEILTSIENPEREENLENAAASPSLRSIGSVVDQEIPRVIQTSHHLPLESPTRDFNINNEHSYLQEKIEVLEAKIEGMNMNEEKYRNEIDKLRAIALGIDSKVNNFVPFIDSNGLDCMVLPIDNIAYAEAFNRRSKQEGLSTFDYVLRQCQEYRKAEHKLKEYDELKCKASDADKIINELTDRLNGFKHKDDEFKQKIEQLERIIDRDSAQLERWEVELSELREERDRMFSSEIGETVMISDEYGAYIYLQKMDESNYEDVYEDEI
jgi:prefoldin subunit 5